jgi:ribosomal protein L40E
MITTFCPRCGSENPFDNQFCGRCGIPLLQPKPAEPVAASRANGSQRPSASAAEPEHESDQTISGPSFLGLSDEPDLSSSYLLDDEVSHSHWGLYLFLLVLAIAGGLVWWQTRNGGLSGTHLGALVQQARTKLGEEKQEAAAVAPNANPAAAENSSVSNPSAAASNPADANSATGANAKEPPAGASPAVTPPPSPSQIQSAAEKQNVAPPAALSQTAEAVKPPSTPAKPQPRRPVPATPSPTASADAQNTALLGNAQKYLYGNGVPQSCDRALSYLRQAVDNDSLKAKSTLGGLYATGHCVPLDRAVAYKWFALALRQDPNNSYLSHDLEMLWNQMTPAQKQLAIRMTQ